jgi:hypothetical protein
MSLKYKEQHKTRRNVNQTHNPKVEGSNPSPATKTPSESIISEQIPTANNELATKLVVASSDFDRRLRHVRIVEVICPSARFSPADRCQP